MNIIFLLTLFFSSVVFATTYEVVHRKGDVVILRNNKPVQPPVETGDQIKVGKRSMLVLKAPGETLKIMNDTVITPYETKEGTLIDLVKGAVVSLVVKKKFQVKTAGTSMGVRGTQFFVSQNEGNLWMCVHEGIVTVTKGTAVVDVPAGKGVFVDKKISPPANYAWTKGINWKMDPKEGVLEHQLNLNYDVLENFYD